MKNKIAPEAYLALDGEDAPDAMDLFGQSSRAHQVDADHAVPTEQCGDLAEKWAGKGTWRQPGAIEKVDADQVIARWLARHMFLDPGEGVCLHDFQSRQRIQPEVAPRRPHG